LRSKRDEADAVAGAFVNELLQDLARHVKTIDPLAVDLEIFGDHAAGHIEGDCDVHTAGTHLGFAPGEARLSERNDEEGQREPTQGREESARARAGDVENGADELNGG